MLSHLTHWGRVMHICVSKQAIIGSDNDLSPGRRQAIIWTSAGILLMRPLGTNFSEILIEIYIYTFKKMHLKMSSGNWWPFCLGLNVFNMLNHCIYGSIEGLIATFHKPFNIFNTVIKINTWLQAYASAEAICKPTRIVVNKLLSFPDGSEKSSSFITINKVLAGDGKVIALSIPVLIDAVNG